MGKLKAAVAAQLSTARSQCGDAKGLTIGCDAVELFNLGAVPADAVKRILDDTGVTACSAHADSQQLLSDPGSLIPILHAVGCSFVAYPWDGIFAAAGRAGARWLIVEQDDHWANGDPMGSLRTSREYLLRKLA